MSERLQAASGIPEINDESAYAPTANQIWNCELLVLRHVNDAEFGDHEFFFQPDDFVPLYEDSRDVNLGPIVATDYDYTQNLYCFYDTTEDHANIIDSLIATIYQIGGSPNIVGFECPGLPTAFIAIENEWAMVMARAHNRIMHSLNGNICKGSYSLLENDRSRKEINASRHGSTYRKFNANYIVTINSNDYSLDKTLIGKDMRLCKYAKNNNVSLEELDSRCFEIFLKIVTSQRMVRCLKCPNKDQIQRDHLIATYYYYRKSKTLEGQLYMYVLKRYNFYRKHVKGLIVSNWIKKFKFVEEVQSQIFSEIIEKIRNVIQLADFVADVNDTIARIGEYVNKKISQAADLFGITDYGFPAKCAISLLIVASLCTLVYQLGSGMAWIIQKLMEFFCPKAADLPPLETVIKTNEVVSQIDSGLLAYIFTLGGLMVFDKRATLTSKIGAARTGANIIETCINMLTDFIDWCAEHTFGVKLFSQEDGATYVITLLKDCQSFVNEKDIESLVITDSTYSSKCLELYESLLRSKYDILHDSKVIGPLFTSSFTEMSNKMRDLYMSVLNSSNLVHQRTVPDFIYLCGPAKQGKSTLMNYILSGVHYLLKNDKDLEGKLNKEHFSTSFNPKMVFPRTTGQAYWEGYRGQWAVTYDDIFAQKDPSLKELTASELLRGVDSSAFLLNMAFGAKGTKYFTSSILVATANNWDLDNVGLQTSEGLRRRISFPFFVKRVGNFDPAKPDWKAWELTLAPDGFTKGTTPESWGFDPNLRDVKFDVLQVIDLVYRQMKNKMLKDTLSAIGTTMDWSTHLKDPISIQSQMFKRIYNYGKSALGLPTIDDRRLDNENFKYKVTAKDIRALSMESGIVEDVLPAHHVVNLEDYPENVVKVRCSESRIDYLRKLIEERNLGNKEWSHHPIPACFECGEAWDFHEDCMFFESPEWGCSTFIGDPELVHNCLVCGNEQRLHVRGEKPPGTGCAKFVMSKLCVCGEKLDSQDPFGTHRLCSLDPQKKYGITCEKCHIPIKHHYKIRSAFDGINCAELMLEFFTTLGVGIMSYFFTKHVIIGGIKRLYGFFMGQIDETEDVLELQQATYTKYRDAIPKPKFSLTKVESHTGNQDQNLVGRCTGILDNVRKIELFSNNSNLETWIFMVTPTMGVITSHAHACLPSKVSKIAITTGEETVLQLSESEFKINKLSGERDGSVITFLNGLQGVKNVLGQIAEDKREVVPAAHRLMKLYKEDKVTYCYQGGGDATWFDKSVRALAVFEGAECITTMSGYYIMKNGKGMPGYCGFPVMSFDNKMHNKPVFGIHVGRVGEDSVVCPLFASDFSSYTVQSQTDWSCPNMEFFHDSILTKGPKGTVSFNKPKYSTMLAEKSELHPSPLHNYLPREWYLTRPRILKNINGCSPLAKAHAKIGRFPNRPMPKILGDILDYDPGIIFRGFMPSTGKYKFTDFEDALFGNDDVSSLEASSSAGYPHVQRKIKPKKRDWFDPSTGYFDPDLKKRVQAQIELMKKGMLFSQTVSDQLKDELGDLINTDPNDIENLKTRLFGVVEMEGCIRTKMVFADFITQTKKHRLFGSVAVATNAHNIDWHMLAQKMFRFGRHRVIGGDIKSMDVSTRRFMFVVALRFFEWYYALTRGSETWFLIYSALYSVVSSIHIIHGVAYMTYDGNSSGNWITTFFNCLAVWVYLSTCFYYRRPAGCEDRFDEKVSLDTYGDDNMGSVHESVNYYNNITINQDMPVLFGVEFTLPSKGSVLEPFLNIEEQVFLSRKFISEGPFTRAPLELSSLFGMLFFVRGETEEEKLILLKQNIDVFLQEMVHFTIEESGALISQLAGACANAGVPFYDSSHVYREIRLRGYTHPT